MSHILIVDDNETEGRFLQKAIHDVYPSVSTTLKPTAEAGWAMIKSPQQTVDLIIAEDKLTQMSGVEFCKRLREAKIDTPFILLCKASREEKVLEAFRSGVTDFVKHSSLRSLRSYLIKGIPPYLQRAKTKAQLIEEVNRLKTLNLELQTENRSLTNFTRSISHDLVTPLSQIAGFADLLLENRQNISQDRQERYLKQIQDISHTAIDQIDVLRNLSDTKKEIPTERCSTQSLLEDAIRRLEKEISARGGSIELVNQLPDTVGRPDWIETLWLNLISFFIDNALSAPMITIRHQTSHSKSTVRFVLQCAPIRLNDHIVGLFSNRWEEGSPEYRNTTSSEAEMVLVIVRRIVELLGGSIGMYTSNDQVVSIYFELKQPQKIGKRLPQHRSRPLVADHPITLPQTAVPDPRQAIRGKSYNSILPN